MYEKSVCLGTPPHLTPLDRRLLPEYVVCEDDLVHLAIDGEVVGRIVGGSGHGIASAQHSLTLHKVISFLLHSYDYKK